MANKHENLVSLFNNVANSIRGKTGDTNKIVADNFPDAINAIVTRQEGTPGTATSADVLSPKTAWVNGSQITGTIPTKTASDLTASGAKVTVPSGYYASEVNKSVASGSATTPATTVTTAAPAMTFNATTGVVTAPKVTATKSVTPSVTAGYISTGTAGTITAESTAATYNVGLGQINTPSGSKTLDKPGMSFNATTGVVTATVASTSITAHANTNKAGYVPVANRNAALTITGNSNTYSIGLGSVTPTFNTTSGNVEIAKGAGYIAAGSQNTAIGISEQTVTAGTASGKTVTGYVNATAGYTPGYNQTITASVADGKLASAVTTHTVTNPSVTISHSGNIATIGSTTKPSGTAGTDYYQIGFSNTVTSGNTNARAHGNVSTAGYVTTANNTASAYSNKTIGATVTQPATYYVNKGTLVAGNISGAAFLENTGDYGFRATVEVPEGYHAGETVTKDFTTGIFPAPESAATADKMLTGYSLYDQDGKLVTGSMPNQGAQTATLTTQGQQYTIPAGYHDGSGKVTASLSAGAYSATQVTAVGVTPSIGGTITDVATTTAPSGTDGTDYYTINPEAAVTNGNARARINTAGYLAAGNKYVNITGSVGAGTNYYIPKSISTNSSSVSGKTVTTTVTIPAGYNPGETVIVSNSVATATHPNPSINKATFNTTSGNVEITANHVQSTGYVTGGTTSASTNVAVGLAAINAPSGSAKQSTPTMSFNTTTGIVSATAAQKTGTAYANVTDDGYVAAGAKSGTFTLTASDAGTYNVGLATINTPAVSIKQSKPGLSFNATTGVVTATVAQKTGTAYANVSAAGYTPTKEVSGTVTLTAADSNTINVGLATINAPSGSKTLDKPGLAFNATTGIVTATVPATTITAHANTAVAGYAPVANRNAALTITGNSNTINVGVAAFNTIAGSKAQSTPTFSINTSTGVVTASVAATSGTAYGNVTRAGYVGTGEKSGTFSMTASSNTYTLDAATANSQSGSATIGASSATANAITPTNVLLTDTATKYKLVSSANATSGAITAKTVTATAGPGYVKSGTVSATATVNAVAAKTASDSKTKYLNEQTISATTITPGAEQTVTVSEGYRNASATITIKAASTGTAAVINAPSGSAKQSKPSISVAANGLITASVAATSGTAYANVTGAGYIATGTKSGTFTMTAADSNTKQLTTQAGTTVTITGNTKIVNNQTFTTGDVYATVAAGALNAQGSSITGGSFTPTLTYNSTSTVYDYGGSKAATGTAYANVQTAGYVSSSNNTSKALSATVSANGTLARTNVVTTVSGTISRTPVIAVQAVPSGVTNAANGAATTNVPNSGVYVAVKSPANTATATATISSASAGYSDGTNFIKTQGTKTAGAAASAVTYIPINAASSNTQTGAATVSGGSASVTLTNITTQTTATDYKIQYNTTGGSVTAKTVTASAGPGYVASGTVSATATVSAASGASNNGIVYLKAATPTNGSASGAATISASGANASTSITGMETTTTNTGFIVSASANATSGAITALTKTATASVTDGYSKSGASATATATVNAVAAKTASDSNTQYIKAATISDFSAKYKAQSKPTFSINTSTGIVTASVAATTQAIYRNVTTGYVGTANTTGITFTMNASSNTYNAIAGLGTTSRVANIGQVSTTSAGLVTNASNGAVNTSDKMTIGTTATNGYYQLTSVGNGKVNTGTGYITAGQTQSNDATVKYYVAKSTVTGHANNVTVSGKTVTYNINAVSTVGYTPGQTVWVNGTKSVADGAINNPSGSAAQSTPTFTFNASNGVVTASVAAKNGTAYRNVTTAGYLSTSTTGGNFQMTASSNTYNVGLGSTTLAANSVTASGATVTYNINATITAGYQAAGTKWINGTTAVATGTLAAGTAAVLNNANGNVRYYRNVSTAGYLAANTTAYYLQLNTKAGGTTTVSSNTLLVNAGQFVTSALYATPAAAVYTTSNADLSCPLLTVA